MNENEHFSTFSRTDVRLLERIKDMKTGGYATHSPLGQRKSSGRGYRESTTTTASVPSSHDGYFNFLSVGDSMVESDACFAADESKCRRLPRRSSSSSTQTMRKCCSRWSSHLTRTSKYAAGRTISTSGCPESSWRSCGACLYKGVLVDNQSDVVCAQSHPVY
uniref:Uncharacterized protein n=1 Tax=Hyaloperonospora arabidopsidis (strain Emoy2) TaxID=559515 RepID=M4C6D0_HYAAE